jgi:hypothetical protein
MGHLNEDETVRGYFHQGGSTAHTALVSVTLLRDVFGDGVISKDIWPPLSLQDRDQWSSLVDTSMNLEYEVLTALVMQSTIFCGKVLCSPLKGRVWLWALLSRWFIAQLILRP